MHGGAAGAAMWHWWSPWRLTWRPYHATGYGAAMLRPRSKIVCKMVKKKNPLLQEQRSYINLEKIALTLWCIDLYYKRVYTVEF